MHIFISWSSIHPSIRYLSLNLFHTSTYLSIHLSASFCRVCLFFLNATLTQNSELSGSRSASNLDGLTLKASVIHQFSPLDEQMIFPFTVVPDHIIAWIAWNTRFSIKQREHYSIKRSYLQAQLFFSALKHLSYPEHICYLKDTVLLSMFTVVSLAGFYSLCCGIVKFYESCSNGWNIQKIPIFHRTIGDGTHSELALNDLQLYLLQSWNNKICGMTGIKAYSTHLDFWLKIKKLQIKLLLNHHFINILHGLCDNSYVLYVLN